MSQQLAAVEAYAAQQERELAKHRVGWQAGLLVQYATVADGLANNFMRAPGEMGGDDCIILRLISCQDGMNCSNCRKPVSVCSHPVDYVDPVHF